MANYKVEEIEGIGPVIGEKLRNSGVKDTDTLLARSLTPKDRKSLAEESELTINQILKFANLADLFRINGVGSEFAELLEAAGVDTVPELAQRNASNLTQMMTAKNEERKLTRRVPSEKEVSKWVEQAKNLPRMLEY